MVAEGSKQLKGQVIPPRDLLVQKFTESRAPELEALYLAVANRLKNDFRSRRNKRRRTTSYDNRASKTRFRKKQKVGVLNQASDGDAEKYVKKAPRHIRRRKELSKNPQSGFCTSGDGTKRLRTHVWHAKRFTMTKRWGFYLPLGLHGRGRGSRALLKWLNDGVVVHDASYYCAIQLEGSQESLLSILGTVMAPFPSSDAENILSGDIYASSLLRHPGATNIGTIAPVIYMWRPNQLSTDAAEAESHGTNGCDNCVKPINHSSFRQLWIWIHAAASPEGYNALKSACEGQVSCTSLEGQFGTLEVMGSKASQLLQKILHPASSMPEKSSVIRKCSFMEGVDSSTPLTNASILENEEHISCSRIIPLTVDDPRALAKDRPGVVPEAEISTELYSSYTELWDASKGLCCPVEESVLCMEKHSRRLSSFCLTDRSSEDVDASTNMRSSRFCPVLVLRRNNLKDSVTRWSIILPLSWVKAFWVPLVSNGARAVGLREKSWVACEAGIASFPTEFPECNSYFSLMETEATAVDKEASLRPASVRPFSIPIPPPWQCVRLASGKNPTEAENTQICSSELGAIAEPAVVDSDLVVARTSSMLAHFLNAINGDRLLLFPHLLDKRFCISKITRDEKVLEQGQNTACFLANQGRKLCFVRVILHAYKEGVIEDGAVVCAPLLADIKRWTSGSNKAELQVPQSSMAAYFVKQDCGKWEFQVPQDPATMEYNRWPIGFVTTGFIRGSKKPSAAALCEAVLLAHLRHEQWSSVPSKRRRKEIYVLTRNLRSTAYRLALASIVLEHQQDDLDHI